MSSSPLAIDTAALRRPLRLRRATIADRKALRNFVCRTHLDASSHNPTALGHQIEDLPTDFPALFSDRAFASHCVSAWVMVIDGEEKSESIAGTIGLTREEEDSSEGHVHINWLFVDPAFRGLSIGPTLLTAAADHARANGFKSVRLLTLSGIYDRAIAMYRKRGFADYKPPLQANEHFRLIFLEKAFAGDALPKAEDVVVNEHVMEKEDKRQRREDSQWEWPGRAEAIDSCVFSKLDEWDEDK